MNSSTKHHILVTCILILLSSVLMFGGKWLAERQGLLIGFLLALSINIFVFFGGSVSLRRAWRGHLLEGQDSWGLFQIIPQLCQSLRVKMPEVWMVKEERPIAFANSCLGGRHHIVLSTGFVDKFSRQELKVVLTYLLLSLQRHHVTYLTFCYALLQVILTIPGWLNQKFPRKLPLIQWRLGDIAFILVAPIVWPLQRLLVPHKIYADLDTITAQNLNDSKLVAEVLRKLQSYYHNDPLPDCLSMAHLFLVNPLTTRGWYRYFHVHPEFSQRIRKLVGFYPL